MATMQKYGSVDLDDYLRMTGGRERKPKVKRRWWMLGAVAGCLCLCSFMVGKYTISLESALNMLDESPREEWERELGVVMTHRHIEKAIAVIAGVAEESGQTGVDASWALTNIAKQALDEMTNMSSLQHGHPNLNRSNLEHLKALLEKPK